MSGASRSRRRAFVPIGAGTLEDRVALSTLGAAHPVSPPPAIGGTGGLGTPAAHTLKAAVAPTARRWSWLAGTYWCVPTSNLPAVIFDNATNTLIPVSDQTVFQITGYRRGYFWGKTVAQFGSSSPSSSSMVGSVTPEGRVVLTFTTSSGSSSSPSVTEGLGQMRRKFGQWTMENQMFTPPGGSFQVGHWAYMVQTRPGLASWRSLPGVGVSVPTFLAEGGGSAPQPVGS